MSLRLAPGEKLYIGGTDISQFYNRLKAPAFPIPLLGLPKIKAGEVGASPLESEYVVPCLTCIPMGATFAVSLAQRVSIGILDRAGLPRPGPLAHLVVSLVRDGTGTHIPYIDDHNSYGSSMEGVNAATVIIIDVLHEAQLPVEDSKTAWDIAGNPGEALGMWWWPEGILTVRPKVAVKLFDSTTAALEQGWMSPREMKRLIGMWTWPCLLRRPLLSVFSAVFSLASMKRPEIRRPLTGAPRGELGAMLDLFQMIFMDLRRGLSEGVYASDASPKGAGVV